MKQLKGFTIVELLIVIVVIGILASITVVAYNGIQQRAHNAKTAAAARDYLSALSEFYAENGRYPTAAQDSVSNYNCLGLSPCWNGTYTSSTALNSVLQNILGSTLPTPYASPYVYYGIVYIPSSAGWTLNSAPSSWLIYAVEGSSTTCPVGPIATYLGGTSFSSTPPTSGQTTASSGSVPNPTCWIPLAS